MESRNQEGSLGPTPTEYDAPDGSWESRAIRQATITTVMPRKQVQRLVRPPLPQLSPRGVRHQDAPTVQDIFAETDPVGDSRAYLSGQPAGYSGTPRNQWGQTFG